MSRKIQKEVKKEHEMELGNLLWGNSRGAYPVPRDWVEGIWQELMDALCADYHAIVNNGYDYDNKKPLRNDKLSEYIDENGWFQNDTFIIRPYYWGDDPELAELSNFEYLYYKECEPFEIAWYKYPFRDSYMSHAIYQDEFEQIIQDCINSLEYL